MVMKMKYFVITVDVEGDNQWKTWNGEVVTTENARYIPRFQELCESFGFKPVYLLTYEMASDPKLVTYLRRKVQVGACEVGTHLHAWSSPPKFDLPRLYGGNPYITEYPKEVIREKMQMLTFHITENLGKKPTSHRAGRWASNQDVFDVLSQEGYLVDCSIVSGWDASGLCGQSISHGFDYSNATKKAYWLNDTLLEVPMIVNKHHGISGRTLRQRAGHLIKGRDIWLRPAITDIAGMKWQLAHGVDDYSMFMIHSTELLPGGSPYFSTAEEVEHEFQMIRSLFTEAAKTHTGCTLEQYYNEKRRQKQ